MPARSGALPSFSFTANKSLDGQYLREDARERQNLALTSAWTLASQEKACEA